MSDEDESAASAGIPNNPRGKLLFTANTYVNQQRNNTYGDPNQDFKRTAAFWQVYLDGIIAARGGALALLPHDVALMIDLLKTSRLTWNPQSEDGWVDKAGYSACGFDCVTSTFGVGKHPLPDVPARFQPETMETDVITGSTEGMFPVT